MALKVLIATLFVMGSLVQFAAAVINLCPPADPTSNLSFQDNEFGYNCTDIFDPREMCERNPEAVFPHPRACQRYFNCSDVSDPELGSRFVRFERECPYPQLFDELSSECKPFDEATCFGGSKVAKDPCEYYKNQCNTLQVLCIPCIFRLPSCVGLTDGLWLFPSRPYTRYHIRCKSERLAEVRLCKPYSFFGPLFRKCFALP